MIPAYKKGADMELCREYLCHEALCRHLRQLGGEVDACHYIDAEGCEEFGFFGEGGELLEGCAGMQNLCGVLWEGYDHGAESAGAGFLHHSL
jgi:hypothetical protein